MSTDTLPDGAVDSGRDQPDAAIAAMDASNAPVGTRDADVVDGMAPRPDGAADEAGTPVMDASVDGALPSCDAIDLLFVVDGSASMCTPFGASTRWQAVRSALIDPARGVIPKITSTVPVGLMIYEGTINIALTAPVMNVPPTPECALAHVTSHMEGECPALIVAALQLDNAENIASLYPEVEPGGSTPTDRAMHYALDRIGYGPDRTEAIVLITGGRANDLCNGGMGGEGDAQQLYLLQEVDAIAAQGVSTFAINLEPDDPTLIANLDEVARHGRPGDPSAHAYLVTSDTELSDALESVLHTLGCEGL